MKSSRFKILLPTVLGIFCGLALFLGTLGFPTDFAFDENTYLGAAREILSSGGDPNWEHPPLAKYFFALAYGMFGESLWDGRLPAAISGLAMLVALFLLAERLFPKRSLSWLVVLSTVLNPMFWVQSRVAMLDIFAVNFLCWAALYELRPQSWKNSSLASVFWGLSLSSKWLGLPLWGVTQILRLWLKPREWKKTLAGWLIAFGVYFATFIPQMIHSDTQARAFLGDAGFFQTQKEMFSWLTIQPEKGASPRQMHPDSTPWWSWPFTRKPLQYSYEITDRQSQEARAVVLWGNPVIHWGGILALVFVAMSAMRAQLKRNSESRIFPILPVLGFLALYLPWSLGLKSVSFYYHYFGPSVFLALIWGSFFDTLDRHSPMWAKRSRWIYLGAATIAFAYLSPLTFGIPITSSTFRMLYRWIFVF